MGRLLMTEIRRSWTLFLRYPSEAITLVITFSLVFVGLFFGARVLFGPGFAVGQGALEALIIRYLLGGLTLYAMTGMGWTIQNEAQAGTLEQLFLSPFGPLRVFFLRALADLLVQLGVIIAVMLIILAIARPHFHYTPAVLPPLLAILLATYGLGYLLGALTLIFKRVQNVIQLSQFIPFLLVLTPVESWGAQLQYLAWLLPMSYASNQAVQVMVDGTPLAWSAVGVSLANGLVYFLLGMLAFLWAQRTARLKGLLGGY